MKISISKNDIMGLDIQLNSEGEPADLIEALAMLLAATNKLNMEITSYSKVVLPKAPVFSKKGN